MERFRQLFGHSKKLVVIGMIHVRALPGTPKHQLTISEIIAKSCQEAEIYTKHKLDAVLVENMHDVPYLKGTVGPEIVSSMTRVCSEVKKIIGTIPMGVQILSGANKEAIAVACSSGGQFVRVEGFVFSHVADEGWIDACSGELMRYRRSIGGENVLVFTDIKKKHSSHSVTQDISLVDTAMAAEFFTSDGVILTGSHTGDPTPPTDLCEVKKRTALPVLIGSGVTVENIDQYNHADGVIIGSHFKRNGLWNNEIEESRVEQFMRLTK